jgi:adenylate cyclase
VLAELNTVFSRFDSLVDRHNGEKIKTIGDGYMVAFGVPEPIDEHACAACRLAIDMVRSLDEINSLLGTDFGMRVGISSGPSIGGVMGTRRYDLWGDNVNLASRLEGAALPGQILVSESVASAAAHRFRFEPCGLMELKGVPSTTVFALVFDEGVG